jgi:hypothetical protein
MGKKIGETLASFDLLSEEDVEKLVATFRMPKDRYHLDHSIMGFSEDFLIKLREVMAKGDIFPDDIIKALEKLVHEKANK